MNIIHNLYGIITFTNFGMHKYVAYDYNSCYNEMIGCLQLTMTMYSSSGYESISLIIIRNDWMFTVHSLGLQGMNLFEDV